MAKTKKKMPGLNTTSTADISFMLLIFFLVTTSMDTDMGLARRLPKPPDPDQEDATMDIKSRNILYVRINAAGQLWIKDEMNSGYGELGELRARVKEFVKNEQNLSKLPEKHVKNIDLLKFGREYQYLKDEEKKAIREYYPQNISEAEPKKYGGDQ